MSKIAPEKSSIKKKPELDRKLENFYSIDFDDNISVKTISQEENADTSLDISIREKARIFPSIRFLMAILLALCFMAISVSTNNISVSNVCMLRSKASMKQMNSTESDNYLNWSSTQEGVFFSGQNAGVLIVLIAGNYLDRFNRKWTIAISISLVVISNIVVPLLSHKAFLFGIFGRLLVGIADMLLQISSSSMITRWFPPKERPFAIGLITGGRQIGSVTIFFLGGYLCYHSTWQVNFYLSSAIAGGVLVIWVLLSADEPKGQLCISEKEKEFIEERTEVGGLDQRKGGLKIPWMAMITSKPLHATIWGIICHEYPMVLVLTLLSQYLHSSYQMNDLKLGYINAGLSFAFWSSKTVSSALSSYIGSRKQGRFVISQTSNVKIFNFVGSLGLGITLAITPFLNNEILAVIFLCGANVFAGEFFSLSTPNLGLHIPGVFTALLQLAPIYSGTIAGISYALVNFFSILSKVMTFTLVDKYKYSNPWAYIFEISACIALLATVFFTIWGSSEKQPWAEIEFDEENEEHEIEAMRRYSLSCIVMDYTHFPKKLDHWDSYDENLKKRRASRVSYASKKASITSRKMTIIGE